MSLDKKKLLKEKISQRNEIIVLPGVFDALSAKVAENAGFEAMFQTGYGSAASLLGMPDFGFLNAGENIENARRIIRSVSLPVIIDVDTGYGNPLTVWKIVNDLVAYGAAGIFLEDQIWPKRCGHMRGKDVIGVDEYIQKLRAALTASENKNFVIVARTDARAPLGFDEAIERGRMYRKEGADVVFVEAPQSEDELREIPKKIDAPLLANMIENGVTPTFSADELKSMGYSMVVFPLSGLYGAAYALKNIFSQLKRTGSTKSSKHMMLDFNEFNDLVELPRFMQMEKKYQS
ncbi:MAG TPA: oxaloacetate decarboxylase [Nitrososphaeraceae archaeon]|jgi:2,3-dimethylmalate lyase|nr:oxaloacetate decarboxylase [Nitrososphaeraceae archaeon]